MRINALSYYVAKFAAMKKVLVAYHSLTGNTEKVAREIAKQLDADVEVIRDYARRKHLLARLSAALEAVLKISASIKEAEHKVANYNLVILGGPVWVENMSSPLRAYIKREAEKFDQVALFCTESGQGGEKVLAQAASLSGKKPLAEMILMEKEIRTDAMDNKINEFIDVIQAAN